MRQFTAIITLALTVGLGSARTVSAQSEEAARIKESTTVLQEILDAPDVSVPKWVAEKVQGIAVFPSVKKAGLLVGGQWGRGILSAKSTKSGTWSAPAFLTLTGGSIGAQIGGEAVDLVLVIIDERGLEQLTRNQFKIGADAGVAAGPGRPHCGSLHRHPDAREDPQLLARARPLCRHHAERLDDQAGSRRERALLRPALQDQPDRARPPGRRARTGARLASRARGVKPKR